VSMLPEIASQRRLLDNSQRTTKPWGWESCIYCNGKSLAIWHLYINCGEQTSLHAHPNKKTALVVLEGRAEVSFLNGQGRKYLPGEKINIHKGVFHQTLATMNSLGAKKPLQLLEIETPNDKTDLVRIGDKYGRKQGYEEEWRDNPYKVDLNQTPEIGECRVGFVHVNATSIETLNLMGSDFAIVVIVGGVETKDKIRVLRPGDAIQKRDFLRLVKEFQLIPATLILVCTKQKHD
jgi:mannose-6-phosphate isomerase-like protein (cupin superfamily)